MHAPDLLAVYGQVLQRIPRSDWVHYRVPAFLRGKPSTAYEDVGNPYAFYAEVLERVLGGARMGPMPTGLSENDRIYLSFPRTFAAADRRIGTALTQIAFLPYLRSRLGVTVFVCLPSAEIGETNRKGTRGSPFAVRNPFVIDQSFADPLLPELDSMTQYRAMVQACGLLGIRPGSIVPMAALSMDCPLFGLVPELGYWWDAPPGELAYGDLWSPADEARMPQLPSINPATAARFRPAPAASMVSKIGVGRRCYLWAPAGTCGVTLANAFPDVVVGDVTTYTWGDVASVRYTHSDTPSPSGTRTEPDGDERLPSWALMPAVVAWRYHELGERVFLIDVSPTVPPHLLHSARRLISVWSPTMSQRLRRAGAGQASTGETLDLVAELRGMIAAGVDDPADTVFIAEELWNFDTIDNIFDGVYGPIVFSVGAHAGNRAKLVTSLKEHLIRLTERRKSNYFLAGVSNHDTAPPPPTMVARLNAVLCFLPRAVPLIFSGTEWAAQVITNREFGFPSVPDGVALETQICNDTLGLFNDVPLNWDDLPGDSSGCSLVADIANVLELRSQLGELAGWDYSPFFPDPFRLPDCFGYSRRRDNGPDRIVVVANWSVRPAAFLWPFEAASPYLTVPTTGERPATIRPGCLLKLGPDSVLVAVCGDLKADVAQH